MKRWVSPPYENVLSGKAKVRSRIEAQAKQIMGAFLGLHIINNVFIALFIIAFTLRFGLSSV
jgi:hypothetical protein